MATRKKEPQGKSTKPPKAKPAAKKAPAHAAAAPRTKPSASAALAPATAKALEIVAAVGKGASFDSLQHLYHDRIEEQELNGWPIDSLAATPYGPAIAGVDSGKMAVPFAIAPRTGHSLRDKWAVVMVTRRTPPGPPVFDDLKTYIRKMLGVMLGEQDYINQLRARTYVDIRSQ